MRYLSVAEMAKKWDVSERSVRNYCAHGRVPGAFLTGKTLNKTKKPSVRKKLQQAIAARSQDKQREREKSKEKQKEPTL